MIEYAEALTKYRIAVENRSGQRISNALCASRGGCPDKSKKDWDALDAEVEKWEGKLKDLLLDDPDDVYDDHDEDAEEDDEDDEDEDDED